MTIRDLCQFDVHALDLEEAMDACNERISYFQLAETDVVSVNVLPPSPAAVAAGVKAGGAPRIRVVMVYWRYIPMG
jgi:hypothetical protein